MKNLLNELLANKEFGSAIDNRDELLHEIFNSSKIQVITYSLSDDTEHQLNFIISAVLKKYAREHLQGTLYTAVKELVINATKANAKYIYCKEKNIDINDEIAYDKIRFEIKYNISEEWIEKYGQKCREAGLETRVTIDQNGSTIIFEILNNLPMNDIDKVRVKEVLEKGNKYNDLVAFYMDHADQTEGAGLGLVMNILLLKGEGYSEHCLSIVSDEKQTMARLEIDLNHI